MKDRFGNEIGAKQPIESWATIDWARQKQLVRNLRRRIFRASQKGEQNRVRSLMKLMLRSRANLLVSIRRVTQENRGKRTAGLDGEIALTPQGRVALIKDMQCYSHGK